MTRQDNAFFIAVIRYLSLHFGGHETTREYGQLRRWLGEPPVGSMRPEWLQRGYRRNGLDEVEGLVRLRNADAPIEVLDIGGMGMRLRTINGEDLGLEGGRYMVSLRLPRSRLRVDLPVEVIHRAEDEATYGVRFCGAPLLLQRRFFAGTEKRIEPAANSNTARVATPPLAA